MSVNLRLREQEFMNYVRDMMYLQEVLHLMFWDSRTGAPKKGTALRSGAVGMISSEKFNRSVSPVMKSFIEELSQEYDQLSEITQKTLQEVKREYDRNTKIPPEEYRAYVELMTNAGQAWKEARDASDFSIFQPLLEELIAYNKRFIHYWGYEDNKYNTLLDFYDPGMTVRILDDVVQKVKDALIPLVKRMVSAQAQDQSTSSFLNIPFPKDEQKRLHLFFLNEFGYDFDAGRLDETVHPFALPLNRHDVRITTRYIEDDFLPGLFGTIHEFGHALYEQQISPDLIGTPLCDGTSSGIHESQSLFWEKMIGRHKRFWKHYYPTLQAYQPVPFETIDFDSFYKAIHKVKPSFIRTAADELTYPLHVIIRYEIEKGLFNDEFEVGDLPKIWNQKMQDYLGITPPDDAKGILQDMHWSAGMFGQFPSYLLGYVYAGQFRNAMKRDLPDFDQYVGNGSFDLIREWLARKIHVHGKMKSPNELLLEVTGEAVNPEPLLQYLEEKYSSIFERKEEGYPTP